MMIAALISSSVWTEPDHLYVQVDYDDCCIDIVSWWNRTLMNTFKYLMIAN